MTDRSNATEGAGEGLPRTTGSLNVTILMGGPSCERQVSLQSGEAVASALERAGHRVTRADIAPDDTSALDADGIDAVFIALHGYFGESGEVQQHCLDRHLKYTGSDTRASKLAMDKAAAKQIFLRAGLATPDWMVIEEYHDRDKVKRWFEEIPPPVVVKPVSSGSSVGITIARDAVARDEALEELLDTYSRAMIERYIDGRELTVGILGDNALDVIEIIPAGEFYDYHTKYEDAKTQYVFDHGLDAALTGAVRAAALTAHRALGCRHMSRVDFILDGAGTPQMLEINTIPGFTSHSLLPMAAARAGISFQRLVDSILAMAVSE